MYIVRIVCCVAVPLREEPGMGGTVLMRQTGNGLEDKDGDEDSGSSSSSSHSGNRFSEAAVSHSSSQNGRAAASVVQCSVL